MSRQGCLYQNGRSMSHDAALLASRPLDGPWSSAC